MPTTGHITPANVPDSELSHPTIRTRVKTAHTWATRSLMVDHTPPSGRKSMRVRLILDGGLVVELRREQAEALINQIDDRLEASTVKGAKW